MAIPLTKYLGDSARYEGFDIDRKAVDWSRNNISPKYANFNFQHADLHDQAINPKGRQRTAEYEFPYANNSFDFAFATSVFTHLLPFEIDHYLVELARVLKTDGRILATFFLLNEESGKLNDARAGVFYFEAQGDYHTTNPIHPRAAVAYEESFIRSLFTKHGFHIAEPIRYGYWSGRAKFLSLQDVVVAHRKVI